MTATNEGVRVQDVLSCILCGTKGTTLYAQVRDRLFGAPGLWNLLTCPGCGLVWVSPQPIPEELGKLYPTYQTHTAAKSPWTRMSRLRNAMKRGVLAAAFGYRQAGQPWAEVAAGRCLSWIGPVREIIGGGIMWLDASWRGRLLDVGCGNGQFLAEMRDLGWKVTGLDPDERAVRLAREERGLEAYQGTLRDMKFPEQSFDVITLVHVIEHAHDPVGTLRECFRVLKAGGRLVVRTPNVASLGHRLFRAAWRGLEVPRHLHLFTPRTLLTCVQQAGFRDPHLWSTGRAARWTWASSRLLRRDGTLPGGAPQRRGLRVALEGWVFQAVEEGLCLVQAVGEELALTAGK